MKSTKAIYKILQKTPDTSLFDFWNEDNFERIKTVLIPIDGKPAIYLKDRDWPFRARVKPRKQSQWMILSKTFIYELLHNSFSRTLLAFTEHLTMSDEMHFLTFAASEMAEVKFINYTTTYIHFTEGYYNPDILSLDQVKAIENKPFFARKIDINDLESKKFMNNERMKYDEYIGIDLTDVGSRI
jgi:hypothetical protein